VLDRTRTWRPDLILLDLMMPRLVGWGFRRCQLERDGLCEVPVIVMTAAGPLEQQVRTLRPAAAMDKPFNLGQLLVTVERVLAGAG
jgi:two-component system chemotaxis response regulator CheY